MNTATGLVESKKGYPFCVIGISPHSVNVIFEDAVGKRQCLLFNRDLFDEAEADVVGTDGIFFVNKEGTLKVEVNRYGERRKSPGPGIHEVFKKLNEAFGLTNTENVLNPIERTEGEGVEFYWVNFSCMSGYEWEVDNKKSKLTGWHRCIGGRLADGRQPEWKNRETRWS